MGRQPPGPASQGFAALRRPTWMGIIDAIRKARQGHCCRPPVCGTATSRPARTSWLPIHYPATDAALLLAVVVHTLFAEKPGPKPPAAGSNPTSTGASDRMRQGRPAEWVARESRRRRGPPVSTADRIRSLGPRVGRGAETRRRCCNGRNWLVQFRSSAGLASWLVECGQHFSPGNFDTPGRIDCFPRRRAAWSVTVQTDPGIGGRCAGIRAGISHAVFRGARKGSPSDRCPCRVCGPEEGFAERPGEGQLEGADHGGRAKPRCCRTPAGHRLDEVLADAGRE